MNLVPITPENIQQYRDAEARYWISKMTPMYQTTIERKRYSWHSTRLFFFFLTTKLINYPSGWDNMLFIDDDLTAEEVGQLLGGN